MNSNDTQDVTVLTLPYFDVQVPDTLLGSEVARLFEGNRALPGVIVTRDGRYLGLVSSSQFFQRLGRPFGIEIYSTRPISVLLESLTFVPVPLAGNTTIQNAIILCLARPPDHVYDPLAVALPDGSHRLVDFLALVLEQTNLLTVAQMEAHAQQAAALSASHAKSDFLANMSHELRTPLTAIIGYGEILIEDVKSGDTADSVRRLEGVVKAGLHLLEMINGILDLSKIEARRMDLYLTTFSLHGLVAEVTNLAQPLMSKNNNRFSHFFARGLEEMHSDEGKLRQCLLNLLGNAAKFTRSGEVELTVLPEEQGELVIFKVRDTGIGMNERQMGRIFEPFYQADLSVSRNFGGTGLGLSLTREYCGMLGGTLSVTSTENVGTTFTMKLPARLKTPPQDVD